MQVEVWAGSVQDTNKLLEGGKRLAKSDPLAQFTDTGSKKFYVAGEL